MERIWQPEGASFQEGTVSMLTESRRDAAASRGGRWVGDTPSAFFAMQRAVGNQAVQHIMAALRRSERGPSTIPDAEPHDEQRVVQAKCACGGRFGAGAMAPFLTPMGACRCPAPFHPIVLPTIIASANQPSRPRSISCGATA